MLLALAGRPGAGALLPRVSCKGKNMSEILFYEKPTALNRENHKQLRFRGITDLSFSKGQNSVPIAGLEFFEASRAMTVLFNKTKNGDYFPVVLLSLQNAGHDLVGEDGKWKGTYIPSFIRRYPFAMTAEGNVCFDADSAAFSETEGQPLFDDEGNNAELLDNVIRFLQQYQVEMKQTQAYCKELAELDFFSEFSVEVGRNTDNPVRIQGLYAVDEKKFATLEGEKLQSWFKQGWVGWTYAHLHSIGALRTLSRNKAAQEDTKAEAANS